MSTADCYESKLKQPELSLILKDMMRIRIKLVISPELNIGLFERRQKEKGGFG